LRKGIKFNAISRVVSQQFRTALTEKPSARGNRLQSALTGYSPHRGGPVYAGIQQQPGGWHMLMQSVGSAISLDSPTLVVVATCIAVLLGLFLLFAWTQDRSQALAWWGTAYLLGGGATALWALNGALATKSLSPVPNALLLIACGMLWSGARRFHGRAIVWPGLFAGAVLWLGASFTDAFAHAEVDRITFTAIAIAIYTFLTSHELWRERRRPHRRAWAATIVPLLHGAVFLVPIPLIRLFPSESGIAIAGGWTALFAIEALLYAVGTAFVLLFLTQQRALQIQKTAASVDVLTGVLNRRAFTTGAEAMIQSQMEKGEPVSLLLFDLDRFKSINDRFGHAVGDEVLRLFARTASETTRTTDIFARLGGEEFVMILAGDVDVAATVAERVRFAFELHGSAIGSYPVSATVSIGVAASPSATTVKSLLTRADAALYRAKANGRNRIELAKGDEDLLPAAVAASTGKPSVPSIPANAAVLPALLATPALRPSSRRLSIARAA
jgi:diguanylate cyclase (GGDEF)-like protein